MARAFVPTSLVALLALLSAACTSTSGSASEDLPEPDETDGGIPAEPEEVPPVASCARPSGVYRSSPRVVSGRCEAMAPSEGTWSTTFLDHRFLPSGTDGVYCTQHRDEFDDSGCMLSTLFTCEDGSSLSTTCEISSDASRIDCRGVNDFVTEECVIEFEAIRTSETPLCVGLGGVYRADIELLSGNTATCTLATIKEIGSGDLLSKLGEPDPACSEGRTEEGCITHYENTCDPERVSRITCVSEITGAVADCTIDIGDCSYVAHFVR